MVICAIKRSVLLSIFAYYAIVTACPVHKSCSCEERPDGYYIDCNNPTDASLNDIVQSLGKRRVQRLKITNATYPKLEELAAANIRSMQLTSCGIKQITNMAFIKLADDLEDLTITYNMLKTVPSIGYLPKLISLNLNYNQLSNLPDNAFKGAKSLRHLRLEGNKICSISSNSLFDIKNMLELLDLSGNCLSNIPAQNLRNCIQLMYLDLSDNAIKEIANFQLMNLPLLKELRLNNNQINSIAPMAFMNVPLLEHLYLRSNRISSIETGQLFQVFKKLEVLDLSDNRLTKVPSFKELSNLRQVHLDHNSIKQIETLAFSSNSKLQLISLQNNQITSMSRNSFDSLDELVALNLANNSIKMIERGMLDGMRNLQLLNLRNNSLTVLENLTFTSVPQITTLDLAHNGIHKIEKDVFTPLKNLFWLDLSSNLIKTLEKDTFRETIANILLNGNPLYCDEKLSWLVSYLVANQVRTFLPYQSEVLCAGPNKYEGVRLKELMIAKANETISSAPYSFDITSRKSGVGRDLLNSILPAGVYGVYPGTQPPSPLGVVPLMSALTDTIPSIKDTHDDNLSTPGEKRVHDVNKFHSAFQQFSAPLIRVVTGGQPEASDIEQFIQAIPHLIVSVPGVGDVDISKLPPGMIAHVLSGGQIPGVSRDTLDKIVKEYAKRMHAATAKHGKRGPNETRYLPSLESLPQELVTEVIKGADLPHLDQQQTQIIQDYYTSRHPIGKELEKLQDSSMAKSKSLPSTVVEVIRMLPPGYNISRIPKPVVDSLFRGEVPDFSLLPEELQQYLLEDGHRFIAALSKDANKSVEEILHNLPTFERPAMPTFVPYDINEVSSDLSQANQQAEKLNRVQYYTALLLGLVGALSIAVLSLICIYMKRKRLVSAEQDIDEDSLVNPVQMPHIQQAAPGTPKLDMHPDRAQRRRHHANISPSVLNI